MTSLIPVTSVTPQESFSDIHFTRSKTGHVHSSFWSYDWKQYNPDGPYQIGSHFHWLRDKSICAFASALGIQESEVMVTVRENPVDGALEWRCGSKHPVQQWRRPTRTELESCGPTIDI